MSYLVVGLGGAVGALARWGVGIGVPHAAGAWPWATVMINLTGCLLIGLLLAQARVREHPWLRPFLATGVLGGYTTFSAFAVDAVQLADAGRWPVAVGYVLVSVVGGLAAVVVGLGLGRRALG